MPRISKDCMLCPLLTAALQPAPGQEPRGTILGCARDSSGAMFPNAVARATLASTAFDAVSGQSPTPRQSQLALKLRF